jgi:hypothetical protein
MTITPHIVGWGHTRFGKHDAIDLVQLIQDAALPAIASAGLAPSDIDGMWPRRATRPAASASAAATSPVGEEPAGGRAAAAHRLLAGVGRRRGAGGGRCRDGGRAAPGGRLALAQPPQRRLPLSRRDPTRFEGAAGVAAGQGAGGRTLDDLASSRRTTASPSPRCWSTRRWAWRRPARARAVIRDGVDAQGRQAAGQPLGRAEVKGHPIGATGVSMHVMAAMQLMGDRGRHAGAPTTSGGAPCSTWAAPRWPTT